MAGRREQGSLILAPSGPDRRTPGARASDEVWRGRRIIGIFLRFPSATRFSFPDVFIRKGVLATACSSLASSPWLEWVIR